MTVHQDTDGDHRAAVVAWRLTKLERRADRLELLMRDVRDQLGLDDHPPELTLWWPPRDPA